MKIVSLFSGAGGLDLGFEQAGFEIIWANEYDKTIWKTYENNFTKTILDKRSIVEIPTNEIPDCDGIIGGPPCQSWSEAGSLKGINDKRGKLFFNYIEVIKSKRPKFFLAENVSGILLKRHRDAFNSILSQFSELGYNVSYNLVNANNYGVPQDRLRVIIVGYLAEYGKIFNLPTINNYKPILRDAIYDLADTAVPALNKNKTNPNVALNGHEYMVGGFSTIYMSRNRVRSWGEPSFTIQAGGRHAPIHPQAPKMVSYGVNDKRFVSGKEDLYRRLTIRECARIQTFPDTHIFLYQSLTDGYKMVGNAVPVKLAQSIAYKIKEDFKNIGAYEFYAPIKGKIKDNTLGRIKKKDLHESLI